MKTSAIQQECNRRKEDYITVDIDKNTGEIEVHGDVQSICNKNCADCTKIYCG